jgi:hypothetical protein
MTVETDPATGVAVKKTPTHAELMERRETRARIMRAKIEAARQERDKTIRAELSVLIESEMGPRGFAKHPEKPGHWRSVGGFGHDLEFRERMLIVRLRPAFLEGGIEGARKLFAAIVDYQIKRQVGGA